MQCFAGASSLVPYPRGQSHRQLTLSCILNNLLSCGFCCVSYKDSLVLFLSSLQSCSYTDLPQEQFWGELKNICGLEEAVAVSQDSWVCWTDLSFMKLQVQFRFYHEISLEYQLYLWRILEWASLYWLVTALLPPLQLCWPTVITEVTDLEGSPVCAEKLVSLFLAPWISWANQRQCIPVQTLINSWRWALIFVPYPAPAITQLPKASGTCSSDSEIKLVLWYSGLKCCQVLYICTVDFSETLNSGFWIFLLGLRCLTRVIHTWWSLATIFPQHYLPRTVQGIMESNITML